MTQTRPSAIGCPSLYRRLFIAAIGSFCSFLLVLSFQSDGHASRPVERTLTGCVIDKTFYSIYEDRQTGKAVKAYRINVRGTPYLPLYEGKTVVLNGFLSPGDRFVVKSGAPPLVKSDTCSADYRKAIGKEFLLGYVVEAHKAASRQDFQEAQRLIGKAVEMDRGDCQTYIDRANIYYLQGDFESGRRDVRFVMSGECPDLGRINFLILGDVAKILLKHGKKAEAEEIYRFAFDTCRSEICREAVKRDMESLKNPKHR